MNETQLIEAIEKNPKSPELWFQLGRTFHLKKQLEGAEEAYLQALQLRNELPEAWTNLGLVFREQSRLQDASECFENALRIDGNNVDAWSNLGNLLAFSGHIDEALTCHRNAVSQKPHDTELALNLANVLSKKGELPEAVDIYQSVLAREPKNVTAHWNFSHALLRKGDWARGFSEFEWRLRRPGHSPIWHAPPWEGQNLGGKRLLIQCEQGFGDTLQFIRYAKECAERDAEVVLRSPPRLMTLMSKVQGVAEVVSNQEEPPTCHAQVMMMSLPHVLGHTGVVFQPPYIHPETSQVQNWARALQTPSLRVGICWRGSRDFEADELRSPGLAWFAPLATLPSVKLFSLQKGDGENELNEVDFKVERLEGLDDGPAAFLDTAAVIESLDVVVSSDTAVAHLAGAMGKKVFVALPFVPDWRWQTESDVSPWYPSMRLFRQRGLGQWAETFSRVADALSEGL